MQVPRYSFCHNIRVAWGDMDALGHVNNVAFNRYFEAARAEYFHQILGELTSERRSKNGPVISKVCLDYRRQVFFPATLEATIGVLRVTNRTFTLGCSIWLGEDCAASGESQHIWIDFGAGRTARMPKDFCLLLEKQKSIALP